MSLRARVQPMNDSTADRGEDGDSPFTKRLRRTAVAIKLEAGDRRCGGCVYARLQGGMGSCAVQVNYEGTSLGIYSVNAYACSTEFTPRSS